MFITRLSSYIACTDVTKFFVNQMPYKPNDSFRACFYSKEC